MIQQIVSDAEFAAMAEFRYRMRRFLRFSEHVAREAGMEPQQHQLLLAARGFPDGEPTIGDLAERLQIHHHSAVELITRTEKRGWLRRERSQEDRRVVRVQVTPAGERLLRQVLMQNREALREASPALARALKVMLARTPGQKGGAKRGSVARSATGARRGARNTTRARTSSN